MKLNEFFTYGADGFEQDKTYEPEHDISILDSEDTRKTRLTLKQINLKLLKKSKLNGKKIMEQRLNWIWKLLIQKEIKV